MTETRKLGVCAALLVVAAGLCAGQDKMAEAVRKGIVEEETNRNLNAAIQSYQSVVTQYDEDRKYAATALFRIAECYRKQGKNDQATAAYKRVVQEFGDQAKLAEQSRSHLPKEQQTVKAAHDGAQEPWEPEMIHRARVEQARQRLRAILAERLSDAEAAWQRENALSGGSAAAALKEKVQDLRQQLAAFDLQTVQETPTVPPRPQ
jgi:tetratricopeptide (TPR) repeat protein